MGIKLEKVTTGKELDDITEQFHKQFDAILDSSNKEVDKVNKHLYDLYESIVKKDGATKSVLDKIMKAIKANLDKLRKVLNNNKGKDYEAYKFNVNSIPGMLMISKKTPLITSEIDHSSVRVNGVGITAVFNDKTRAPIRVEHEGIAYPILLSDKGIVETLKKGNSLDDVLTFEIGFIKNNLSNPNTFKGFKDLQSIGDMYAEVSINVAKEMKISSLLKELEVASKSNDITTRVTLIRNGINLIGVNTLAEAKLLGDIIKREKDSDLQKKVIKGLFGQA